MGGLRSGMGYVGAANLDELRDRANFVRITAGGLRESHTHDIVITEEPTNYQPLSELKGRIQRVMKSCLDLSLPIE